MNMIPDFNFSLALPEIFLVCMASFILIVDAFIKDERKLVVHGLSMLTLLGLVIISVLQFKANTGTAEVTFYGMYIADHFAHVLKIVTYIAVAITLIYGRSYSSDRGMLTGEFYLLVLFALLGQMVMISANHLLIVFLGLELMSLPLYALVALRRNHVVSTEAAMKYFILGSLATGIMLYGISMIYGGTGALDFASIQTATYTSAAKNSFILSLGIVFLVCGTAFKLGVVPFHMWVPDVYQGSPTSVTLVLGAAPKLATFAVVIRLFGSTLSDLAVQWEMMFAILAVLSLIIGNLAAIMQQNIKRMLAFSTISHMGFVLLGLASGGAGSQGIAAYTSSMFYVLIYVLTTLGSFGMVMLLSQRGVECETLDDLKGLNRRHPLFAGVMMLLMFSLAGIPPTVGFFSKLFILSAVISAGYVPIAIIAVIASLIGAFYYLRVVKVMYFDEPLSPAPISAPTNVKNILLLNGALVLVLSFFSSAIYNLCKVAINSVF